MTRDACRADAVRRSRAPAVERHGAGHELARHALHARHVLNYVLRTRVASALVTPRDVDDYLQLIDPMWSVRQTRARVVSIEREAPDVVSLWLAPNEHWRGFQAGQSVAVAVSVDGVRTRRWFSLSSAPADGLPLRITIKAAAGGRVSRWANHDAAVGDVVELGDAVGAFVLPEPPPANLVLISGGSGITPMMSLLRQLRAIGYRGGIHFFHYARRDVIFDNELAALATSLPNLQLIVQRTAAGGVRRLARELIADLVPAWEHAPAFVCGPASLRGAAVAIWQEAGLAEQLRIERFTPDPTPAPRAHGARHRVQFVVSGHEIDARDDVPLLAQAEAAGLAPEHGCRVGMCGTCSARKRSGSVRDLLTGQTCSDPDVTIRLCIHTAQSDVILDL